MEELSPSELDKYLSKFLLSVRKKNGEEYEPTTLRGFVSSVERYLKKRRYCETVVTGHSFNRKRETLNRFNCKYSSYIVIKWQFVLILYCVCL